MAEVTGLNTYPLTCGVAVSHEDALMLAGGLEGDRQFVPYDPATGQRVSQKKHKQLYGTIAIPKAGGLYIMMRDGEEIEVPDVTENLTIEVDEFGDKVPCTDMGPEAAELFSRRLDADVRLARKSARWLLGYGVSPAQRRNAPLHIIFDESVEALQERAPDATFGADRFRANIRVRGFERFAENQLVGRRLRIGSVIVPIVRLTQRCEVPSHHPFTGQNLKDVAKLYRDLDKGEDGKAAFGVYGAPDLEPGHRGHWVSLEDPVELLD